jgi:hypothetical protein
MPRNAIQIDRIKIEIPGGSVAGGQRIALLVAAGLAEAGALPAAGDIPAVQIELTADANANESELAQGIVAAMLRQLQRLP